MFFIQTLGLTSILTDAIYESYPTTSIVSI